MTCNVMHESGRGESSRSASRVLLEWSTWVVVTLRLAVPPVLGQCEGGMRGVRVECVCGPMAPVFGGTRFGATWKPASGRLTKGPNAKYLSRAHLRRNDDTLLRVGTIALPKGAQRKMSNEMNAQHHQSARARSVARQVHSCCLQEAVPTAWGR